MKKRNTMLSLLLVLFLVAPQLHSQDEQAQQSEVVITPQESLNDIANLPVVPNDPQVLEENIGSPRTAEAILQTILLDNFEVPQGWKPDIPLDFGIARSIYREGAPEEIASENNKMVLGVKTFFFRRNFGWMSIDKNYPIMLKNVVRSFSLWIAGRNRRHKFFIKVRDINHDYMRLPAGEMRWRGWKKVIVPVGDAVIQQTPKHNTQGLDFLGFHIDFNAEDIVVTEPYFIYFDYLTASVNMGQNPHADDMVDDW